MMKSQVTSWDNLGVTSTRILEKGIVQIENDCTMKSNQYFLTKTRMAVKKKAIKRVVKKAPKKAIR